MANISDTFNFEGIMDEIDAPDEFQPFMERLLHRLDLFRVDLLNQLNTKDEDDTFDFIALDAESGDSIEIASDGGTIKKT